MQYEVLASYGVTTAASAACECILTILWYICLRFPSSSLHYQTCFKLLVSTQVLKILEIYLPWNTQPSHKEAYTQNQPIFLRSLKLMVVSAALLGLFSSLWVLLPFDF